jgi:hypothetical protein
MPKLYKQLHAKWGKTEIISSKVRNETRVSTLFTLIQHSPGVPSQSNVRQEEEIKGIHLGKEEIKEICRRHYLIPKRPRKLYHKTPRHHKHLQQSSRIQNQFTKISSLSIHQQ